MTAASAAALGATLLAGAAALATAGRVARHGAARRTAQDYAVVLGCAAPVVALLAPYLGDRVWAAAAAIAAGYGGFYLVRTRQLRRADRDGVRSLLGLHRDASYGEVLQQVERVEPRAAPSRVTRAVSTATAVALVAAGAAVGRLDAALVGLMLGVAETSLRPAWGRALARRVRSIGR